MNLRFPVSALLLLLAAKAMCYAQGWRGIEPLRSTRVDVERLVGKPNAKYERYQIENEEADIAYSRGECLEGWKVPADTVIKIHITFKGSRKLSDLNLDLSKYVKFVDPHVTSHVYYVNRVEGLMYVVFEGNSADRGEILDVYYQPASKDDGLRCSADPKLSTTGGWQGIMPLQSTRAEVEKALGPALKDSNDVVTRHETKIEEVRVQYSTGEPCGKGWPGIWRIPPGTVVTITVHPKKELRFAGLKIDESKFKKTDNEGHSPPYFYYTNEEEGIQYEVTQGLVMAIRYLPASRDDSLRCPKTKGGSLVPSQYHPFQSYGNVSSDHEKSFLDNFAAYLLNDAPKLHAYVVTYSDRRISRRKARSRALRAKNYLVKVRGVPATRVTAAYGGIAEQFEVKLYALSSGLSPPNIQKNQTQTNRGKAQSTLKAREAFK